jgi:hypothetical protein
MFCIRFDLCLDPDPAVDLLATTDPVLDPGLCH